MVSRVRRQ